MSLRRRKGLVEIARRHDALIIADDVYDFLQWPLSGPTTPERAAEMRIPRLVDIDRAMGPSAHDVKGFGHAISNGSFSKIAAPGCRTGWVEATPAFVQGLSNTGSTLSGGAPSQLVAAMLGDLIETGELEDHIEKAVRPLLQRRHRIMVDAVDEFVAPFGAKLRRSSLHGGEIYGGYFVWFSLEDGLCAEQVARRALEEENLIIGHGNMFSVKGDESTSLFDRDIRLSFAWEPEDSLVEGVKRLGTVLRSVKEEAASL